MNISGDAPKMPRVLGFWALVIYGFGDILGAGIYALTGKIAGIAGHASWIAFTVALAVAGVTALSYAELSGRFPQSGGEAKYCQEAFGSKKLALFIGWLVLCSGVVSLATVSLAFAGYLLGSFGLPLNQQVLAGLFLVAVGAINFWGMKQTSLFNILCTSVEFFGLILVLVVGITFLSGGAPATASTVTPATEPAGLGVIFQAAALAFFAFIGFEDMVNVAEEVRNPRKNLPAAILTAVSLAGVLYIAIIWIATRVVPPAELGESTAPLLEVVKRAAPGIPPLLFSAIALFAVGNTGLLNFVMGSRLLYGMAGQDLVPRWFGKLHPLTSTPHRAILVIFFVALVLALSGTLTFLAGATSALLLVVFFTVNISLVVVRKKSPEPYEGFHIPVWIAATAAISCLVLVGFISTDGLLRALIFVVLGIGIVFVRVRRSLS